MCGQACGLLSHHTAVLDEQEAELAPGQTKSATNRVHVLRSCGQAVASAGSTISDAVDFG